jgi:type III secretion protein C
MSASWPVSFARRVCFPLRSRWALPMGFAMGLAFACGGAGADPIPFGKGIGDISARDQPISAFLQNLFGTVGVRVAVSPAVTGAVNGHFAGTAESIYRQVARAFNLVEFYDGSVLHIGTPQDLQSRTLKLDASVAAQLTRTVNKLGIGDTRNRVRSAGDGVLLITGLKRFVEQVEELARLPVDTPHPGSGESASPAPSIEVRVFYLRYAWAQDLSMTIGGRSSMLPGVASTLRSLMSATAVPATPVVAVRSGAGALAAAATQGSGVARGPGTHPRPDAATHEGTVGPPGHQAPPASALALPSAAGFSPGQAGTPSATINGRTEADTVAGRIEADARLNAVLVRDSAERMPTYEALIRALDVEPKSVEIEATLIDVNTDKLRELGIQWRYSQGATSLLFGRGDATDLNLMPGTKAADITLSGAGGFASAILGNANQFIARISALETQGAARVVSSPQVLTLSNVEAVFDSSQTFYVRIAGRDEVDLFNVSAGTTLRVTPHVFQEGKEARIKMRVAIEDGSLSTRTVDTLPVVDRASITTQAMIFEGESLLIGGISRESRAEAESRVPLLADLPWIGRLFRQRRTQTDRLERLFLITPRLAAPRRPAVAAEEVGHSSAHSQASPASPALQVQTAKGPRASYAPGERYGLDVSILRDGFLYCYLVDIRDRVTRFFPGESQASAAVSAGTLLNFPGSLPFRLVAPRTAGQEEVACMLASDDPGPDPLQLDRALPVPATGAALQSRFRELARGAVDADGLIVVVR